MLANPEIQKEYLKEVKSVLGKQDEPESLTSPDDLPYTKVVFLEALRLHSPVVLAAQVLEKDLMLHDHIIPKNTNISLPVWMIQRGKQNYPSPLELQPDCWVPPKGEKSKSAWEDRPEDDLESNDIAPANCDAFLAFSAGAWNCVGKNLAMREAVTLLAYTIRKVKFELVDESYKMKHKVKLLQSPHNGLPMIIRRR